MLIRIIALSLLLSTTPAFALYLTGASSCQHQSGKKQIEKKDIPAPSPAPSQSAKS